MDNLFVGKRVRLRAVELSDADFFFRLDDLTTDYGRSTDEVWFPSSRHGVERWVESQIKRSDESDAFRFMIETVGERVTVDTLNTHTVNKRVGIFMYGIAIAPEHQRQGYAAEAIRLCLRYYFQERRYQKVTAEVYSFNRASIALHERLGFALEGRLRRMVYTNGQFYDALLFGLLREEFEANMSNSTAISDGS